MNVLLIKMNSPADEIIPPISLGYLAQTIKDRHNVKILDCLKEGLDVNETAEIATNYDMVGITLFTKDLSLCKKYLKTIKAKKKDIIIFLGGPHPSAVPKETLDFFGDLINLIFIGESEISFPQVVEYFDKSTPTLESIEGIGYKTNEGYVIKKPKIYDNIDDFKIAWELIPPNTYPMAPHGAFFKQFPVAPIITSRGCPYHCTFCGGHIVSGRKIRQRSIDNVMEEISLLCNTYGVKEIHIEDDNFTFNKKYVLDFCKRLKDEFPQITWTCPNGVRIDTLDEEVVRAMKDSGCYAISLGIESGSDRVLKMMKKSLSVSKIKEKIDILKKFDIDINAFFILGYPGETKEDIKKTISLSLSLPLKRASFANYQPLPGTELYYELLKKGLLKIDHWENFAPSLQSTIWSPPSFTVKELIWIRRYALLRFYLRFNVLINFIKSIKSLEHLKYIFKRAIRWLFYTGKK